MSTKIYYGIRIESSKLKEFMEWFDETCIDGAVKYTKNLMGAQKIGKGFKEWDKKKLGLKEKYKDIKDRILYYQLSFIFAMYYESSKTSRNGLNMDCWFNAYPFGKWFYVIPMFPEGCKYKYPKYVQEYGYWNNTDPQEGISDKDWIKRGKEWESLIDDNDKYRMSHRVIEAKDYWNHGLTKVERKITEKFKETFPPSYFLDVKAKEFGLVDKSEMGDEIDKIFSKDT